MKIDKSRIRSCVDHINTAVDVDPWAKELVAEMGKEILKAQLSGEGTTSDCISRQAVIDTEGLDEQIRCEMCRNPMHTNRGCDGNCKYDEKLYERIMQILGERIKLLPSAQPEIIRCKDCKYWMPYDWMFSELWRSQNIYEYAEEEKGCRYCDMDMRANDFCSRAERKE